MRIEKPHPLKEYRQRLGDVMNQMVASSIAIVAAESEQRRSNDTYYRFRQASDFYYLTGFSEPDALLVIIPGRKESEVILFCHGKDAISELWDGYRHGPEVACKQFAIDDAFPIDTANDIIPGLIEGRSRIYYSMGNNQSLDDSINLWLQQLRDGKRLESKTPHDISDFRHLIHELRLFKSRDEIKLMQKAADISVDAHKSAMMRCKELQYEYQLQADIEYHFALNNCEPAYSSIVGSGSNACVLHYTANNEPLTNGNLVLIDAGAEYAGYAADITRTFPINGKFSEPQRRLYTIVLEAEIAAIEACQVGKSFIEPHNISVEIITKGLVELGILSGDIKTIIKNGDYRRFYPHRAGHWLGIDVHDVGDYKVGGSDSNWREFEPGMVTTIEPGIYIQPTEKGIDSKYLGIGIRIEDDVLITKKGPRVLTEKVPKTITAIEKLMH